MVKKILFICKYNVLRSKIAEAYLKKIDPAIEVKSAGIIAEGLPLYDNEKRILNELNLKLSESSNFLSRSLLDWADRIVIIAKDIPKSVLDRSNSPEKQIVEVWEIEDSFAGASDEQVKNIITAITSRIDKKFGGLKNENE